MFLGRKIRSFRAVGHRRRKIEHIRIGMRNRSSDDVFDLQGDPALAVELKADTIRTLDRSTASGQQSDAAEPPVDEVPY